jgi:predicted Zn-dependent peptidase
LASAHVFLGNAAKANTEVDEYLAVTPQDLQRVAQQYFIRENRVVLHYLPMDRSKN